MLKRPPTDTSNTINSFRKKRQQQGQFLMYGAIALVVLGLILLIYWLTRPEQPLGQFFATDTPTVTVTSTATTTSTAYTHTHNHRNTHYNGDSHAFGTIPLYNSRR